MTLKEFVERRLGGDGAAEIDLQTTLSFLEDLQALTQSKMPHAVSLLEAIQGVLDGVPYEWEEFAESYKD